MNTKRLKELRKQRKISILAISKATGLHRTTITRVESGTEDVTLRAVNLYIEALKDIEVRMLLRE